MTDWLNFLPEVFNYWALACFALGCLNIYQYAHTHKLSGLLGHLKENGHAPDGKVLVDAQHVTVAEPARTPAEILSSMMPGGLPKGWHIEPDIQKAKPQPGVLTELAESGHAAPITYSAEAVQAARAYRVALATYGAQDPRTKPYLAALVVFPQWLDVVGYAGSDGYDAKIEQEIRRGLDG